jgi:BCCT family betaine/carnitine transporter
MPGVTKANSGDTGSVAEPKVLWPSLAIVFSVSSFLALYPGVEQVLARMREWLTDEFGWLYLLVAFAAFIFMLWLAFGRYGRVKLGREEDVPEFSDISWIAMLFCAGVGIALISWAFVEPVYFLIRPPLGAEPGSGEAIELAAMYPFHHWGVVAWAIYGMPALPVAYSLFVRRDRHLRFSHACRGVIGEWSDGVVGKLIDFIVIFSIIGAVGTSLGLAIPLVTRMASAVFGIEESFALNLAVLAVWTLIFGWSVYRGLDRGIRVLSDINVGLALFLLVFVLVVGPTAFILNLWANSFGLVIDNFIRASFWTDPIARNRFPQDWTIFYWAWWFAYSPMMGIFVGRLSRGRTVRQVVVNGVLWPALGSSAFFAIWGGYAIHLTTQNLLPVDQILTAEGMPAAVVAILQTLPLAKVTLVAFALLSFVFLATTLDSSAYAVACVCTREMPAHGDPPRWLRMLWTFAIAGLGVGLLKVGGLDAVQLSTLVGAFPLLFVFVLLALSFWRLIHRDFSGLTALEPLARSLPRADSSAERDG